MRDIAITRQPGRWRLRWVLTRQEMLNIAHHPYHLVSLAIPIFLSLVFGLFTNALRDADALIVVVYDAADSRLGAALQAWPDVIVDVVDSETAVLKALDGDATGGIIIPAGFDTAVAGGQTPVLVTYLNTNARSANIADFKRLLSEEVWAMGGASPPAAVTWEELHGDEANFPIFSGDNYVVAVFLLLGITLTSTGLLAQIITEKRENGALSALLTSPLDHGDLLFGQATAVFIYTVLLAGILILLNRGVIGNVEVTIVATLLTTLVLIGLGVVLGLWSQSKSQCSTYGAVITLILVLPSWFGLIPLADLSALVAFVLRLLPTTYFVNTLLYSLNGQATWSTVGLNLAVIAGFAVVIFGLAGWQLRRRPLVLS